MTYPQKRWLDVVSIISGKAQRAVESNNGKYPIYGSGGVIGRANSYLCDAGTTIIGRKGTINAPIFVNEKFWNVDTAFGIKPSEQLVPKFLFYFCEHFNFKELDKSTTIPSVAKRDLLNISMPVPAKSVQELIVAKIEELFSDLDKAVDALQTIRQRVIIYRQAVLKKAFSKVENYTAIQNISITVTSGSRGWAKYYSENGSAFIRIGNLTRTGIDILLNNVQHVQLPEKAEGMRTKLCIGDVLVSITADLGSIGLVTQATSGAYINQHIAMIRFSNPKQGKMLAWYLRSEHGQKELLANKRGGGKLGLGLDDIRNAKVPKIDNNSAENIVANIESQMTACDNIEQTVNTALQQAAVLRQSILKQAFEGKLIS